MTKKDVRVFYILFVPYYFLGVAWNYTRLRMPESLPNFILMVLSTTILICFVVYIVVLFKRLTEGPEIVGISLGRRQIIPIAVAILLLGIFTFTDSSKPGMSMRDISFSAVGAFVEESLFRALFVNVLIYSFGNRKNKVLVAIVMSSIFWGAAHIPSYGLSFAMNLFLLGLAMSGLYYWTRSAVAGIVLHVVSNAGLAAGYVAFVLYLVFAFVARTKQKSTLSETIA